MYKVMQGQLKEEPKMQTDFELSAPVVTVNNGVATVTGSGEKSQSSSASGTQKTVSGSSVVNTTVSAKNASSSSTDKTVPTYEEVSSAAPSDNISERKSQAKAEYENWQASEKPQYSRRYGDSVSSLVSELEGREFSYDPANDEVYQRYRESVKSSAELALADATGLAAALNGGYATSYAQIAGQTAFVNRMKEADEMIPELYEAAYDRFSAETDDMEDRLDILRDLENDEWDKYMDLLEDYNDEGERLYDRYSDLSDEEFDRFYSMYKLTV